MFYRTGDRSVIAHMTVPGPTARHLNPARQCGAVRPFARRVL